MNTTTWTTARNDKTSLYEVHADDCKHLIARHMEVMTTGNVGEPMDIAQQSAENNGGCVFKLGPCARRTAQERAAKPFASAWTLQEFPGFATLV